MFLKAENLYLFLALILLISTNLYLTCRLLPKKEGFMKKVKKEIDKVGKTLEKNILGKVTDLIKDTLIKQPINAIPYKPLRNFFLDSINFSKDLGTVIQQLLYAIVKAMMTILIMVPIVYWIIMTGAIPQIALTIWQGIMALNSILWMIPTFRFPSPSTNQFNVNNQVPPTSIPNPMIR